MVSSQTVDHQLKQAGYNFRLWGRAEVRELSNVLMPDEQIAECTNGHYAGGFALIVATDQRLILIDRKPMYLTIEAVTYDMVREVDFHYRLLDATIRIFTLNKALVFTSWNHHRLRAVLSHTQQRLGELRQQNMAQTAQRQEVEQPQLSLVGSLEAAATAVQPLNYVSRVPTIPGLPHRRQFTSPGGSPLPL